MPDTQEHNISTKFVSNTVIPRFVEILILLLVSIIGFFMQSINAKINQIAEEQNKLITKIEIINNQQTNDKTLQDLYIQLTNKRLDGIDEFVKFQLNNKTQPIDSQPKK